MEEQVEDLEAFTRQLKDDGFTHVLWSGMGGSSLFPQVLCQAFGVGAGGLDLRVLDTSDPGTIHRYAEELPSDRTSSSSPPSPATRSSPAPISRSSGIGSASPTNPLWSPTRPRS